MLSTFKLENRYKWTYKHNCPFVTGVFTKAIVANAFFPAFITTSVTALANT